MIPAIDLTLTRDQARIVESFFTYIDGLCNVQLRNYEDDVDMTLKLRAQCVLYAQFKQMLARRLFGPTVKFKMKIPYPNALAIYLLLQQVPIDERNEYMILTRQQILDAFNLQMLAPLPDRPIFPLNYLRK